MLSSTNTTTISNYSSSPITWANNALRALISLLSPILPTTAIAESAAAETTEPPKFGTKLAIINRFSRAYIRFASTHVINQSSLVDQDGRTHHVVVVRSRSESFSRSLSSETITSFSSKPFAVNFSGSNTVPM